jgi:hypothetical protein
MPDLIIKPTNTSGNKVIIQDQAGGAVLTTADSGATLSNVTVTAGTLGANVNLNHDAQEDSWHIYLGGGSTYSSASQVDFGSNVFIGSDVSESGGAITVSNAGLYWVSVALAKLNGVVGAIDCQVQVEGTTINGCYLYVEDKGVGGHQISSRTISIPLRLAADDVVRVYGTGAMYGGSTNSMCYFTGTRIGAKS